MPTTVRFQIGTASDQGPRTYNADAVHHMTEPNGYGETFLSIADGVGDNPDAMWAATDAVANVTRQGTRRDTGTAAEALLTAAAPVVAEHSDAPPGQDGDTTLVVVVAYPDHHPAYSIAWVGDSRAWRYTQTNGLEALTNDHTLAETFRHADYVPAPYLEHQLTVALSHASTETIGTATLTGPHGRLILTTDGIHKPLSDDDLHAIVADTHDPQLCAETLVTRARDLGATDNATALVADPRLDA